jgi:tRNA A37 threonylcarbamoyladenosine synthetase subunit TsaC/SUA5/YrdC
MVFTSSTARFPRQSVNVILAQTDTTVGFLSQDSHQLYEIKSRVSSKPFIKVFDSFKSLGSAGQRVPKIHKKYLRNSKKTTFIVKNNSFRIAQSELNSACIRNLTWSYSTSANESGKKFKRDFCEKKADIIVEDSHGLEEKSSSAIYRLSKVKKRRLR